MRQTHWPLFCYLFLSLLFVPLCCHHRRMVSLHLLTIRRNPVGSLRVCSSLRFTTWVSPLSPILLLRWAFYVNCSIGPNMSTRWLWCPWDTQRKMPRYLIFRGKNWKKYHTFTHTDSLWIFVSFGGSLRVCEIVRIMPEDMMRTQPIRSLESRFSPKTT